MQFIIFKGTSLKTDVKCKEIQLYLPFKIAIKILDAHFFDLSGPHLEIYPTYTLIQVHKKYMKACLLQYCLWQQKNGDDLNVH